MKLFKRVVEVSEKSGEVNTVQLAREARRDYVLAYARIGKPESAKDEFARSSAGRRPEDAWKQYGKLLFDTGRDPEAQLVQPAAPGHPRRCAGRGAGSDAPAVLAQRRRQAAGAARRGATAGGRRSTACAAGRMPAPATPTSATRRPIGWGRRRSATWRSRSTTRRERTELEETWSAARALYANYLTLFPDAADAYDLRFFYGELLYSRA